MYMADWVKRLDAFLQFNEEDILHDKGKVTAAIAKAFDVMFFGVIHPLYITSWFCSFQGQVFVPQVVVRHHRVALVALHTEYCHLVVNSFHSKCHRVKGGQLARGNRKGRGHA